MSDSIDEQERVYEVRKLWMERTEDKRTAGFVGAFCVWLKENRPRLVPSDSRHLYDDLRGLIDEVSREGENGKASPA